MLEINSSKNSTIKEVKALYRKKNRWAKKQFIIEGIKIIEEAIDLSMDMKSIFYSEDLFNIDGGEEFFKRIENKRRTIKVSEKLFKEISDLETPQGVLSVVGFDKNNIEDIYKKNLSFTIFLDGLNDPGNLGTIIRSADAFGVDAIVLGENTVDPYNSKVVRATMGSLFRVPIYDVKDNKTFFEKISENDVSIVTTSLNGKLLEKEDFSKDFIIVIGNEANGVSNEIIEKSTKEIKIPMLGGAESLNAGVAASIMMYEAMKNRN